MDPLKLYFDVRDIFRSPRLALSGKKIFVFLIANLFGWIIYWLFTNLAFVLSGYSFSEAWDYFGLYPCLFGNQVPWYSWVLYAIGLLSWFYLISLACTAVSRITYKQLKGDEFFSSGDSWKYVKKHWHPVIFTSLSLIIIAFFFVAGAAVFGLFGKIPFVGEYLFALPYLFYFFGSIFTVYTLIVFFMSIIYTPAIVSVYEEDTMGSVFQSYSLTWSQPWRIVLYHAILIPLTLLAAHIFKLFWMGAYHLINVVMGHTFIMGEKLTRIVGWASDLVLPNICCAQKCESSLSTFEFHTHSCYMTLPEGAHLSGTELGAGIILAFFFFILLLSVFSYALSIFSVGETLMFVIFKKKSDNDNLLERKDEDELEEEAEDKLADESDSEDSSETEEENSEEPEESNT